MAAAAQQRSGQRHSERRSSRRYPICLDVVFKLRRGRLVESGAGQTRDVSSCGVLFESSVELYPGARIELCIAWPVLLNEDAALNLFVTGQTVRTEGGLTAVQFVRYVFRVRSRRRTELGEGQSLPISVPDIEAGS